MKREANNGLIGYRRLGSFDCRCLRAIYGDWLLTPIEEGYENLVTS